MSKAYNGVVKNYAKACGLNVSDADINKVIKLQEETGKDINYFQIFLLGLQYRQIFDTDFTEEDYDKEVQALLKEHPEIDPETKELTKVLQETYQLDELSNKFKSINIPEIFEKAGFKDNNSVIVNYYDIMDGADGILTQANLNALKINALIKLGTSLGAFSNDEEKAQLINFGTLDFVAMMDAELNEGDLEASEESQATEDFKEQLGEEDNDVLSIKNVLLLRNSLPNDIGLLYSKYY